jgi:predicted RNase H-like nuclease (RuvC/YqgF family)
MIESKKTFLINLSIMLLFLSTITHAEPSALPLEVKQQQTQIQELQTELKDANSRISALETTLSSANKINSNTQSDQAFTVSNRMANGHGR